MFLFTLNNSYAQDLLVKVRTKSNDEPIENASVLYNSDTYTTNRDGNVTIPVDRNKPVFLKVTKEDYKSYEFVINDIGNMTNYLIRLQYEPQSNNQNIIVLDDDELQVDEQATSTSSLLRASRDGFLSAAAFNFFAGRFRVRGYANDYTEAMVNGLPMKNLHNSRIPFNYWGGLNDMFRLSSTVLGLDHSEMMYGNLNGGSNVELGAISQRKQFKSSYAISNRSYRNRLMTVYSTGEMENGWAFSVSGSRRWAQQGYIKGTFYDAWSYLASAEKRIKNHTIGLVVFGAPRKNGRGSGSVNEMYELSNDRYYNPNWGYQNGKVRNSKFYNTHQPVASLRHKAKFGDKLSLDHSVGVVWGRSGRSRLDWYSAPDPRPDYYRYLPSYFKNEEVSNAIKEVLLNNEEARQLNWHKLYETNKLHRQTITNVNGIEGNTVEGLRSLYALQEDRDDLTRYMYNGTLKYNITSNMEFNLGLTAQKEKTHFHRSMVDLLGGDFWLDVDQFAERENSTDPDVIQSNLENPNNVVKVGDTYGYSYESHVSDYSLWIGYLARLRKFDFNVGAKINYNSMYRNGLFRDGNFPDESLGKSEVVTLISPSAKLGVNYKINGRNYIYLNTAYQEQAPDFRNTFLSSRTRNKLVADPKTEKIYTGELAYVHRSPKLKLKGLLYYTQFKDVVEADAFYLDGTNSFVNYVLSGMERIHRGTELSGEYKLTSTLSVKTAAGIGQHFYSNRPTLNIIPDLGPQIDLGERAGEQTVYIKNYRVPGAQTAAMLGLSYNSPKYWFVNLSVNYFDNIYLDFNPDRRTEYAVRNINKETQTDLFYNTINQTQLKKGFTVDIFGGKSFKVKRNFFYLNVGINNILNNRDFITGGFEQSRLGFSETSASQEELDKFPNRYFYAYGINYFISLSYKI